MKPGRRCWFDYPDAEGPTCFPRATSGVRPGLPQGKMKVRFKSCTRRFKRHAQPDFDFDFDFDLDLDLDLDLRW